MVAWTPEQAHQIKEYQQATGYKKDRNGDLYKPWWAEHMERDEQAELAAAEAKYIRESSPSVKAQSEHLAGLDYGVFDASDYLDIARAGRTEYTKHQAEQAATQASINAEKAKLAEPKAAKMARLQQATTAIAVDSYGRPL